MDKASTLKITRLLQQAGRGNREALNRLMPVIYEELRNRAARYLQRERPDHTLQTTDLAHEAYLRLIDQNRAQWIDRVHFFSFAATCIRRILVDHARRKRAAKRGDDQRKITLAESDLIGSDQSGELLALNEALARLGKMDLRKARAVELRYFGGLKLSEIAGVLGTSVGTVERDLRLALAWLNRELSGGQGA